MFFDKFTIKNYKCFSGEQSLKLAIPQEDVIGSGITYIVGANNSGKTTIIEGLSIKNGKNIKTSDKIQGTDPEFQLYENGTLIRGCRLIRPQSSLIVEEPALSDRGKIFEIVSSRRHWAPPAGNLHSEAGATFHNLHEFDNRQNSLDVGSELRTIESNEDNYYEFIKLVQRVIPEFTQFAVAYEDNHYIEYISSNGTRHKSDLLGDGVITLIRILLQVYVNKPNPIIIDEPELSLHPSAQRKLLKVLAEYSQKRQIIISTHSPYMVSWEYLKTGAVINRVVKEGDTCSQIFPITNFTKYVNFIKSGNWQMPFAMDEVAKEIFFMEDGILFLEGQEDVGLLKIEPLLSGVNIFGYGVRGVGNFKFALALAQDLGYKKVSCVLDFGPDEIVIKGDLERDFPKYQIIQWNKEDIRDKPARSSTAKTGYFTNKGQKKPSTELDDFEHKLTLISTYMTG